MEATVQSAPDMDLLERIAERAGMDETAVEEALADIVVAVGKEPEWPARIPPYFDRYITTELRHLKEDIAGLRQEMIQRFEALRGEMDQRFGEVDRRFREVDQRFDALRDEMDLRFGEVDRHFGEVDRRFGEVDRRFGEVDRRFDQMDHRFDRLERWFLALGVPIMLSILAVVIKVFFRVP